MDFLSIIDWSAWPTKDRVTVLVSAAAFLLALTSFLITFFQKSRDTQRALRRELTDVVSEITSTNIEFNKLSIDHPADQTEHIVNLRRNLNSKLRYLCYHGHFLAAQNPSLLNDVDCVILAGAFSATANTEKAQWYWRLAIAKSPNTAISHMNMRGFARFSFISGNAAAGRKLYAEALELDMPQSDSGRRYTADTYAMWASAEKYYGSEGECARLIELAISAAKRIGNEKDKAEMLAQIEGISAGPPASNVPSVLPA